MTLVFQRERWLRELVRGRWWRLLLRCLRMWRSCEVAGFACGRTSFSLDCGTSGAEALDCGRAANSAGAAVSSKIARRSLTALLQNAIPGQAY